ncbi:MAG: winged helix-turn-helix domain-containing protein [Chloroflexi bacterium]|nr:winged helix-turn-helix domain-containing protein [Chloroflexota bacterium]
MKSCTLTIGQARRFLLTKHGLVGQHTFTGTDGVLAFVRQAGCIQFDPVDICGRNAELVLQSRVRGFSKQMLDELLYVDRRLVDYFDKNLAIVPVEGWPNFERTRQQHRQNGRARDQIDAVADQIKAIVHEKGAASAGDVGIDGTLIWYWGGQTKLARAALETLYFRGDLVIHHKQGALKHYALAEDCLPVEILQAPDPHTSEAEYAQWHVARRIGSVGLLWNRPSMAWLGSPAMHSPTRQAAFAELVAESSLIAVDVDGLKDRLFCLADDRALLERILQDAQDDPRTELLAPLDNLLWDRKLIKALFGFDYTWEVYTPAERRKYGHYVLPILSGERFIGRAELVNERKTRTLRVKNVWLEDGVERTDALGQALADCWERFARFNACACVRLDGDGYAG